MLKTAMRFAWLFFLFSFIVKHIADALNYVEGRNDTIQLSFRFNSLTKIL